MRVEFHPAVEQDLAEALRRYDSVSERLGEEFQVELRRVIAVAAAKLGRFHLIKRVCIAPTSNASPTTSFIVNSRTASA